MIMPDFESLFACYERVRQPLAKWLPAEKLTQLEKTLHDKSQRQQPSIMVYGIYNAGKSTLLNALMGRADAPMADRPETASITPYHWQGFVLFDTPGIDAPVEHEKMTHQHLDDSDVVLFVVAAGGAIDESATWQSLVNIVARERRVMLIVNNKIGIKPDSSDYVLLQDRLRQHLQTAAQQAGITDILSKVDIHLVNARSALKARLENKPLLLENSGIEKLEAALYDFLSSTDYQTQLKTCQADLLAAVEAAQRNMAAETDNGLVASLQKAQSRVMTERNRLSLALHTTLDKEVNRAERRVASLLAEIVAQGGGDEEQVNRDVAGVVDAVGQHIDDQLASELPETQQQLYDIGQQLASSSLGRVNQDLSFSHNEPGQKEDSLFAKTSKEMVGGILKSDVRLLTEKGVQTALEYGKKWLPELFKGIGPKTMGKWASAAGRWAGPLLQVGTCAYDLYQAHQQEQEAKNRAERNRRVIEDTAASFATDLKAAYRARIRELLEIVFQPIEAWLAEQTFNARQQDSAVASQSRLFSDAVAELNIKLHHHGE